MRFNCVVRGDYGELVKLWLHDVEVIRNKKERRSGQNRPEQEMDEKTRQHGSLISKGQISKASG